MADFFKSPSSSSSLQTLNHTSLVPYVNQDSRNGISRVINCNYQEENDVKNQQLTFLEMFLTLFKKSFSSSSWKTKNGVESMEVGCPTDVRHVAHVTFDRFHGFLGLPVEFEPDVPKLVPSASTTVFGVSTESMQVSYDSIGNSIPTILLLLQHRLYCQDGLKAEGIFRINADNSQEERLRSQLNSGVVPDGIDVHCLAGLIKAWFRELPNGVLDHISKKQLMQCQSEEECLALVRILPPTETALLDWVVNLMADVVEHERFNKMSSRNISMVFAPNMTQMRNPLTTLMYVVQVMNFIKTLISKTLRERGVSVIEPSSSVARIEPSSSVARIEQHENKDWAPPL